MNVFELFAKIGLDSQEYENGLTKCASMGKSVMSGIGNVAKVGFGVATAAIGAGTAAMGAFGKSALGAYSSYEQLTGGVNKLFGEGTEATQTLMKNAEQAYKTAGMSSNKYMETATSFSASLLKSLDGDAEKAAEITDTAIRAMSDNANTFGTDISEIEHAIMGISKNNYTMIDNLKLGFAGSKEGAQQLIDRANELKTAMGEVGDLSLDSFADMITAIELVQKDLGVAGTTAKEAMTTIEGSSKATQAAWENLTSAIGRGEGITEAFQGLNDAIFGIGLTEDGKETGLLNQVIPRIQTIMSGAGEAIVQAAPLVSEKLPELIDAVLPTMLQGGISLAGAIGSGLISALPSVWESVTSAASTVGDYLYNGMEKAAQATENVDFTTPLSTALDKIDEVFNGEKTQTFIDNGVKVVTNIATGIGQAAPDILPKAAEIVVTFVQGIEDNIPQILDAGADMAVGLAVGLVKALPKLWLELQLLKVKVIAYIAEHVAAFILKAKDGAQQVITNVGTKLAQLPEKVAYYAGYAVTKFWTAIKEMPEKAEKAFNDVMDKAKKWKEDFPQHAKDAITDFKAKFKEGVDELISNVWEWGKSIADKFISGIKSILDGAGNLFSAFQQGAAQAQSEVKTKATTSVNGSAVKGVNYIDEDASIFADAQRSIDYDMLGKAIVRAFVDAEISVECDSREFGRLVRKAVMA